MKNHIFIFFLLLSGFCMHAQSKAELAKELKSKEQEIQAQKRQIDELKASSKKILAFQTENEELKKLLRITSNRWLKPVFIDKYLKDDYLEKTNLAGPKEDIEKIQKVFEQYDLVIKSVKITAISEDTVRIAQSALNFNENYLRLFELRNNIFMNKYDSTAVHNALKTLDNLPELIENSNLQKDKNFIRDLMLNYASKTCILKKTLDELIEADQGAAKKMYQKLENDDRFKDYPYLIRIITEIQEHTNSYTNDDLPCFEKQEPNSSTNLVPGKAVNNTDQVTTTGPQPKNVNKGTSDNPVHSSKKPGIEDNKTSQKESQNDSKKLYN